MTPPPIERRRVLASGVTVALGVLAGCEAAGDAPSRPTASGPARATTSATAAPPAPATAPARPSSSTTSADEPPASSRVRTVGEASPVDAPRLARRLERYLDGRGGRLGLELVDLGRGESFSYRAAEAYSYSTVKVLVLTTLLRRLQTDGVPLTPRQRALATAMITRSDNAAMDAVLDDVGRPAVREVAGLLGMRNTVIDDGRWALWRSVPGDLNRMVDGVLSSDTVLDGAHRTVVRLLMADVVREQRWGVFAPESRRVHVAAKNGWGPLPDGYRLHSAGWVSAGDREYVLSIMSTSRAGFDHGRRTISDVARMCHEAVGAGLA